MAKLKTAKDLYKALDKYVVGQENVKKALSTAVFLHHVRCLRSYNTGTLYGNKSNILITGPSGCGKTYLIDVLDRILGLPILRINAKEISRMGYKGVSMDEYILNFADTWGGQSALEMVEHSLVFIDEVDKICLNKKSSDLTDWNLGIQHTLLKTIEGTSYISDKSEYQVNTKNMLFILAGNFEWMREARETSQKLGIGFNPDAKEDLSKLPLHQQLIKAGMIRELAGRISVVEELKPLTKAQLRQALLHKEDSALHQYEEICQFLNIKSKMTSAKINSVIDMCHKNGTGARGLQTALDRITLDQMFETETDDIILGDFEDD